VQHAAVVVEDRPGEAGQVDATALASAGLARAQRLDDGALGSVGRLSGTVATRSPVAMVRTTTFRSMIWVALLKRLRTTDHHSSFSPSRSAVQLLPESTWMFQPICATSAPPIREKVNCSRAT
jgi:hypothetical protein